MTERTVVRRDVMRATGALLGTCAIGGLSGCVGGGLLGKSKTGFTDWMYVPGEISDQERYGYYYLKPKAFAKHEEQFSTDTYDSLEQFFTLPETVGLDFDETDWLIAFDTTSVLRADYVRDDVVDDLEDDDWEEDGNHEGYTVFVDGSETTAVGVGNGHVVRSSHPDDGDPVDVLETTIDAKTGSEDRYADDDDDFSALVELTGTSTYTFVTPLEELSDTSIENGQFEHQVGWGYALSIGGETTDTKRVVLFKEKDDVDVEAVRKWTDERSGNGEAFDDHDDVSVKQKGRSAVITASIDTEDLF